MMDGRPIPLVNFLLLLAGSFRVLDVHWSV
jgi:hypothetical protein